MAVQTVNPSRSDPYKNFRFRVLLGGRCVAGASKVSTLKKSTEIVEHREGGDRSTKKALASAKPETVTLERGVTHDAAFGRWAGAAGKQGATAAPKDVRKDLVIEQYDEAGRRVSAHRLFGCRVSALQTAAAPNAGAIAIQTIKIEHQGWSMLPT